MAATKLKAERKHNGYKNPWTDEAVAVLRRCFSEGRSGREMLAAINAILPDITMQALASKRIRMRLLLKPGKRLAQRDAEDAETADAAEPEVKAPRPSEPVWHFLPPERRCQWPFGEPGKPDFHMCGERSKPGLPYCTEHIKVAYARRPFYEAV